MPVEPGDYLKIEFTPRGALIGLVGFVTLLLLANAVAVSFKLRVDQEQSSNLIRLVDFSAEKNIPTLFSSIALICCAALLALIALARRRRDLSSLSWLALAVIFLFLAIDETASLHESLTKPLRESLNTSGLFYYAWVIPYGAALVAFLALFLRFLVNLPRTTRMLFVSAGAIYIFGALGLEMLGGLRAEIYGVYDLGYSLIVTAEEFLEMLGIVIFGYALLAYVAEHFEKLTITVGPVEKHEKASVHVIERDAPTESRSFHGR